MMKQFTFLIHSRATQSRASPPHLNRHQTQWVAVTTPNMAGNGKTLEAQVLPILQTSAIHHHHDHPTPSCSTWCESWLNIGLIPHRRVAHQISFRIFFLASIRLITHCHLPTNQYHQLKQLCWLQNNKRENQCGNSNQQPGKLLTSDCWQIPGKSPFSRHMCVGWVAIAVICRWAPVASSNKNAKLWWDLPQQCDTMTRQAQAYWSKVKPWWHWVGIVDKNCKSRE